ncbi:hypothetical protein ACFL11_00400 [Patescibacteria group bacterium]
MEGGEMENKIPLSGWAQMRVSRLRYADVLSWSFFVFIYTSGSFVIFLFAFRDLFVLGILFILVVILEIYLIYRVYRRKKRRIIEDNFQDHNQGKEILSVVTSITSAPPDLENTGFAGVESATGLLPVRVDYLPQEQIIGELGGTLSGRVGFYNFYRTLSGSIKGRSTPQFVDQSVILICVQENGDSVRLICPSIRVLRESLVDYFRHLSGDYGSGSYTYSALGELNRCLQEVLDTLNSQQIYDHVVTKLRPEVPQNQIPKISARGLPAKEGSMIVCLIECAGRESEPVIPIGFLDGVKNSLEEILAKSLPSMPLLGSGG